MNTARALASIRRIAEIKPIAGADKICAYRVDGWWCVDTIEKYNVGDIVVYVEIDSWVPASIAPFLSKGKSPREYGGVPGERLRTVKLRGQVSQGLLLPISPTCDMIESALFEGLNVSFPLGIQKWEPVLPACLAGQARGNFPSWGRKTDQERIENIVDDVFIANKDALYEVTLKLNGSSCSVWYKDGEVGVCSRNLDLKLNEENAGNSFIATATSTGLLGALKALGRNIMVQAELMGPDVQGNPEKLTAHNLYVFDIFDIDDQEYLDVYSRKTLFAKLSEIGYTGEHVPIIARGVTLELIGIFDVATSKAFVDRPSIHAQVAEGCVFKRLDGKFSFKSINNRFLLKERD